MRVVVAQYEGVTTMRPLPLAAGLLVATARARSPDLDYGIETKRRPVEIAAERLRGAAVVGFSLYTWNERYSLAVARRLKSVSPSTLVVVGGPSVPRDDGALRVFLDENPVDLAVLGEGELAFAELLARVEGGLDPLVFGAARLVEGRLERAGPRARLAGSAFSETASPYLDGTFDRLIDDGELDPPSACVFETNRGCPFSCSFCDWGQATESRVNELPLDRVLGELEWAARRGVHYLYLVDANFGIRRRDEDITRHLGELKARLGAPSFCYFHLTKNAQRRNLRTVELLQEAGIGSQVSLSMQDLDLGVLEAIRRDNIDPNDALALREHCHERGLPTTNELLLGLPRQTLESVRWTVSLALTPFATDSFFLYPVRLLPNAPLTAEVERHGLVTRRVPLLPRSIAELHPEPELEVLVVGSPTLPIPDWREAFVFGHALAALHDQALAPLTMRYALWQAGMPASDFIDGLLARFPPLRTTLERYADAILDELGTMLPLDASDTRRWEPIEAAVAIVLAEPDRFFEALRGLVSELGPLALEACAVDRLSLAADGASPASVEVSVDWTAFTDGRVAPAPNPGRLELGPVPTLGAEHLAWFLAHGWARAPRRLVRHVQDGVREASVMAQDRHPGGSGARGPI